MALARLAAVAVVAVLSARAAAKPPPQTAQLLERGKRVYEGTAAGCAACHGMTGEGNGPVAFAIKPPPRNFKTEPFKAGDSVEQIFATVTAGLPGTKMVGYPQLPEPDRWAIAYYVRSFRPAK